MRYPLPIRLAIHLGVHDAVRVLLLVAERLVLTPGPFPNNGILIPNSWKMIPLVTLVAFTLMGIEGIADEIEMPFGRDQSDLPLGEMELGRNSYSNHTS